MPATYDFIASASGTGSSATVTFSSVPQTYTDLVLVSNYRCTTSSNLLGLIFNGDTGVTYSAVSLFYNTSTTSSNSDSAVVRGWIGLNTGGSTATDTFTVAVSNIMNYTSTNIFKTTQSHNGTVSGAAFNGVELTQSTWRSQSAITTVGVQTSAGFITADSTFALYGIKAS